MKKRTWEVHPGSASQYAIEIHLHPTRAAARKAANEENPGAWTRNARACTTMYHNGEEPAVNIHLSSPDLTLNILTHEFAHAAIHLAMLKQAPIYRANDETMPYILGDLIDGATEIGLIEYALNHQGES